jgi:hypothetical protein
VSAERARSPSPGLFLQRRKPKTAAIQARLARDHPRSEFRLSAAVSEWHTSRAAEKIFSGLEKINLVSHETVL